MPGTSDPAETGQLQNQPSGEPVSLAEVMQRFGGAPAGDDQRGRRRTVTTVQQRTHLLGKGAGIMPVEAQRTRGTDVETCGAGLAATGVQRGRRAGDAILGPQRARWAYRDAALAPSRPQEPEEAHA